jgi:hypothetical protein
MGKYKLIALDVDGTLITDDHRLTRKTREAVRAVHEQGARIVLCTGRGAISTLPVMEELGLEGIVITHNGGATIRSTDRQVLHTFGYPVERFMPLVEYCRERGIHFDINTAFDIYVEQLNDELREGYRLFFAEPVILDDVAAFPEPVIKFCAIAESDKVERILQDWSWITERGLRMMRSGTIFVDVMHEKTSKGNALKVLAEQWGIPREEVLAIGNYYNDLEMIRYAGLGIAMANSPDEVKREADAVTEASNNEDGVYEALVRHCLDAPEAV